jgi:hypothetical protein
MWGAYMHPFGLESAYKKHEYMRNLLTRLYATRMLTSSWASVFVDLAVAVI